MPAAEARVPTENASRYLSRLCRHAGKMGGLRGHRPRSHAGGGAAPEIRHAESSDTSGTLIMNWGQCTLRVADGVLTLRAEASDQDSLTRITELIAARLEKFGRREHLAVTWQPVPTARLKPTPFIRTDR
jgi:hypothetical protein